MAKKKSSKYLLEQAKARFFANVKELETGCWRWEGYVIKSSGYGRMTHAKAKVLAHRMAYMLHKGPIPEGLWVLHRCDYKLCVNPQHLFLGTAADNTQDMVDKGRAKNPHERG